MINIWRFIVGFSLPMNARDLFRRKVDIQITCYENILTCNLSWRERENTFYKLSSLYHYKYVLDNVENYKVRILPDDLLCNKNTTEGDGTGYWILDEDF
jgi:hypothetical protein